jgi:hypothetical protein
MRPCKVLAALRPNHIYNGIMSISRNEQVALLLKTADFYRRSLADYAQFARSEAKPRTKKQLELRLQTILKEINDLNGKPAA